MPSSRLCRALAVLVTLTATCGCLASTRAIAQGWRLPGIETNDRRHLDPEFADRVSEVVADLREEGFRPRVASTYRDAERQQLIFEVSQIMVLFGGRHMTGARGGRSCHNHRASDGSPASLAADILPGPELATAEQRAAFFHALGRAAHARGLGWGGDWVKRNPVWRQHGLGWDPGHVQSERCRF